MRFAADIFSITPELVIVGWFIIFILTHEVRIYKEVRLVSNIVRLSKKIGVTPKTLSKIVNFVENEVRNRYLQYNS